MTTIEERIKRSIERFNDVDPKVLGELAEQLDKLISDNRSWEVPARDKALAFTVVLFMNIREKVERLQVTRKET